MAKRSASVRITVRLQPGARRREIVGMRDGVLVVRVQAPPLDGRANMELRKLIAKRARLPTGSVTILRGAHSREKVVEVDGIDEAALMEALDL